MRWILIGAATAALAAAQSPRVFHLTQNETPAQMQEMVTLTRAVGDIPQIAMDEGQRTVSVGGTAAQLDMAGWFIQELDRSAPPAGMQEYRPAPGADDVVRVFFLGHVTTPQQLQEMVTNVRAVLDIRRVFIYNSLEAMAVRGTAAQMAEAAWLVNQLDLEAGAPSPGPVELRTSSGEIARVFNLTNPRTPQEVQEIVTTIRSIADIQRVFIYNKRKAISMRTTPDRLALAEWLVGQLDRPAPPAAAAPGEYTFANDAASQVRVFYLPHNPNPQEMMRVATQVRTTAPIQRLFVYSPLAALAVRGTVGQVANAEKVLQEMGQAK